LEPVGDIGWDWLGCGGLLFQNRFFLAKLLAQV